MSRPLKRLLPLLATAEPGYMMVTKSTASTMRRGNAPNTIITNCLLIPGVVIRKTELASQLVASACAAKNSAPAEKRKKSTEPCKPKICEVCNKELKTVRTIVRHRKYCGIKAFGCSFCSRRFTAKDSALHHEKLHTGERPYKCSECDKAFITKNALTNHVICRHASSADFVCETCGKAYASDLYLKAHISAMHRGKRFLCEQCGKAFKTSTSLRSHKDSHLDPNSDAHPCDRCDKTFKSKQSLKQHMKRHYVKFACGTCNKNFKSKKSLLLHERNHAGEKPYKCTYCDKAFVSNENRIVHERVHTGERPYQCEHCSQTFTQRHVLKTHWKRKHPDKTTAK